MKTSGSHVLADVWLSEYEDEMEGLIAKVELALATSGMTVLGKVVHDFGGKAFTGVWLLSESHMSIHTFPERNFMNIDCFTCGDQGQPLLCVGDLIKGLQVDSAKIQILKRGE